MSKYDAVAQRSLATITRKGSDVTFATVGGGQIYDPFSNTWSGGTAGVRVGGKAVQIANDTAVLTALGVINQTVVTLLVGANGLAVTPVNGMVMGWAGSDLTVESVEATAPDGVPILYTVIGAA